MNLVLFKGMSLGALFGCAFGVLLSIFVIQGPENAQAGGNIALNSAFVRNSDLPSDDSVDSLAQAFASRESPTEANSAAHSESKPAQPDALDASSAEVPPASGDASELAQASGKEHSTPTEAISQGTPIRRGEYQPSSSTPNNAGAATPELGRLSPSEQAFLKEALENERERLQAAQIHEESGGHEIVSSVFKHGGSARALLRQPGALVERIPADEGEPIEINGDEEWLDFIRTTFRRTEDEALTVKLGPGEYRHFSVIETSPRLTVIGTLPEGMDFANRTQPFADESAATIMMGVTVYREGAQGTLAFRNLIMNRNMNLREESVVRCENVLFQRREKDGGRLHCATLSGDGAIACINCCFVGGPHAYSATGFNLSGQGLIQLTNCRIVNASVITIGSHLATERSEVVLHNCVLERSRLIRHDNTRESLFIEAIGCTFYSTKAEIEHRDIEDNSTPYGCSLKDVAKECSFEPIAPLDVRPLLMGLVEKIRLQGGPIQEIHFAQPGGSMGEWIVSVKRLPTNWTNHEAGTELEADISHWVIGEDGTIKAWNDDDFRHLGNGINLDPTCHVPKPGVKDLSDFTAVEEFYPRDADIRSIEVRIGADGSGRGLVRRWPWCIRPAWLRFNAESGEIQ